MLSVSGSTSKMASSSSIGQVSCLLKSQPTVFLSFDAPQAYAWFALLLLRRYSPDKIEISLWKLMHLSSSRAIYSLLPILQHSLLEKTKSTNLVPLSGIRQKPEKIEKFLYYLFLEREVSIHLSRKQ